MSEWGRGALISDYLTYAVKVRVEEIVTSQRDMVQRAELAQRGNRDGSPRRRTTVEPRRADDRESLEKVEWLLTEYLGHVPSAMVADALCEVSDMLGREQ